MLGSGATGVTRSSLSKAGLFAGLDAAHPAFSAEIPGDAVERQALGYLHANCGVSCHNDTSQAAARLSELWLRLDVDRLDDVHATDAVTTGINRAPSPNVEFVGLDEPRAPSSISDPSTPRAAWPWPR